MKKAIVLIFSLLSFVFLVDYERVMADSLTTATSNVSFNVTAGNLSLTSVPVLRFETRKREDAGELSDLTNSSSEISYSASTNGKSNLVVTDYRGASSDTWAVYAQLSSQRTTAVINLNNGAHSAISLSKDLTKITNTKQPADGKTVTAVDSSNLKINHAQERTKKNSYLATVTWVLADTFGSQE